MDQKELNTDVIGCIAEAVKDRNTLLEQEKIIKDEVISLSDNKENNKDINPDINADDDILVMITNYL